MGGNQFTVSGEVTLKTAQVAQGARQVGSEIEGLAKSGIAGFEATRQKVIDLTKQLAGLRNELLKTNDPARQAQLNAQLTQTQAQFKAARTEMHGMNLESGETREKIQMLAGSLGVQVPAGIARIMARMPALTTAMSVAFNATLVVAVGAAIVSLFPKIADWIDKLRGVEDVNEGILEKQIEINRLLVAGGKAETFKALEAQYTNNARRIGEIDSQLKKMGNTAAAVGGNEGIVFGKAATAIGMHSDAIKALNKELKHLTERQKELDLAIPKAKQDEQNKAMEEAAKAAEKAGQAAKHFADYQEQLRWSLEGTNGALQALIELHDKEKRAEELATAAADAEIAVRKAGLKDLPPVIKDIYTSEELATDAAIAMGKAQIEAAKKSQEQYEKLASSIESFIDRVFLHARSLSDVFHQFLMQLLGSFVKWVSQMVARALLGMKQVSGAQTGGGGILGSILGGIFGLGGAGAAPAFAGTTGGLALPGGGVIQGVTGGLSAGAITPFGGGSEMTTLIGAGGNVLVGGGIPKVAGGSGLAGLGLMGAGGLLMGGTAALGRAGGVGGPITGAIGGAMMGVGAAGMMAALGGTSMVGMLGAALLTTPYGWIALAAIAGIGALIGALGRGKAKRKATAIEVPFEQAAAALYDQYKQHEVDFESVVGGLQALIEQGQQAELSAGLGKWGRKGAENLTRIIEDLIQQIQNLEKQRQANAAIIGGTTVPEFAIGGPVTNWQSAIGRGGMLAILHPGEFVMRREAVENLGTNSLASLNRAPRFVEGGSVGGPGMPTAVGQGIYNQTFHLYQLPGESQQIFVSRVARAVRRAIADRMLRF